eukprot:GFYU01000668.1.p1 GENE.GFYU01000668.1~~GFYU01000668.1.p1  ORF type:complete len:302 (+),score=69.08 GFYU01000668.1:44-907(+)
MGNVVSSLKWAFVPNATDPKHRGWAHPIFSAAFTVSVATAFSIIAADRLRRGKASVRKELTANDKKRIKGAWILFGYLVTMLGSRLPQTGPNGLYDFMWACNVAMVIAMTGLATDRPLMVSAAATSIAVDQFLWYVDCAAYLTAGKWPIGVAKYLTWDDVPFIKKITATHHIWFMPFCLYYLKGRGGVQPSAWSLSVVSNLVLSICARVFIPFEIKNPETGQVDYMNVNLTHECWPDVPFWFLQVANHKHWLKTMAFSIGGWNTCNVPFFLLLRIISHFLLEKRKLK